MFRSPIYYAVRSDALPKSTAIQILLLASAMDSNNPESEVEKAVFEDKELFGPERYINANQEHVVERRVDVNIYDGLFSESDLAAAGAVTEDSRSEMGRKLARYEEQEGYLAGDGRKGALSSSLRAPSSVVAPSTKSNTPLSLVQGYVTAPQSPAGSAERDEFVPGGGSTPPDTPTKTVKGGMMNGGERKVSPGKQFMRMLEGAKRRLRRGSNG